MSQASQRTLSSGSSASFTKGAIVKIYLKDFMTYSEVDFTPGPNLNLILGPNGTGKSTIVSAICLGMNGKPSTIARASTLAGYVRHGANKATIQIELHNPEGQNYCVSREITLDNKSTWKFQGKPVTHGQIEEVIKKLHIQVDNLCQFLPQEQVQNFSRLKDKQLLVGTMKAVGKPELEEQFDQLIKMQSVLGSESLNQEKDELELKKLQEENKRWEGDVKSFKERETLKSRVKILGKKKLWLQYKEDTNNFKELYKKATELSDVYEAAAARFKPLEKKIAEKESLATKSQNALKLKRDKFNHSMETVKQRFFSADQHKQKMENLASDLQGKRTSEKKRLDSVKNFQQQIANLERELEECQGREEETNAQLREVDRQFSEISPSLTDTDNRKIQMQEEGRRIRNEMLECQSKIKNIEDVDRNRINMLRQHNLSHIQEAIIWLRANKDKFRAPIYEPPIVSLSVKNGAMAKYIEGCIGFNDLVAFFCENKEDMNELMRVLREEKRLGVNVVHSPSSSQPSTSEFSQRVSIAELRDYGFYSYVRELFVGPDPVVRYLCKNYQIHNIPVGDKKTYENFGAIRDRFGSVFSVFFGDTKRIGISKSRYQSTAITQISDVRESRFLGQSVDSQALQRHQADFGQLEQRMSNFKAAFDKINQEETDLKKIRENLLQKKNNLLEIISGPRVVKSRLDTKRSQLKNLDKDVIDIVAEERLVKEKCGACVRTLSQKLKEYSELVDQLLAQDKEREALQIFIDIIRLSIQSSQNLLSEEKEQIKTLKNEKDAAQRLSDEAKRKAKQSLDEVQRVLGVKHRSELPDEIAAQFEALPSDITGIEDEINSATARIQLMGRADEQIVRDYEQREYRINEIIRKINSINTRAATVKDKMDKLKNEFLTPLQELISRINVSFGRFYASMKCAGEVCLHTGEGNNDDDFKNYGIKIRVKYRSSEPLIDLSANHHSGGERAVATALYMLAMQELTQVPFRCVDEINQGMDPINERRVFDLLVQTACRETSAQYFLLTPKLLPNLQYSPNMKIHFVQNGEHVCNEWKIDKHLQAIRAMKA